MAAILTIASVSAVAALWGLTPFALFGVRGRLDRIVATQRRHTEEVASELRRLNALLQANGHRLLADPPQADRTLLVRGSGRL